MCDDANDIADDGCNYCDIETGWDCTGGDGVTPSICMTICGDETKVPGYEQCDDGNTVNGDGCASDCFVED